MPDPLAVALMVAACAFAFANGINDGGALISIGLKMPVLRPWLAVVFMTLAVGVVPVVLGTGVATTLATRLVTLSGPTGSLALLAALIGAAIVVQVLTRRGIPTSLTLAVIGGITGAGLGAGLAVSWTMVSRVLLIAATAPLFGALVAYAITKSFAFMPSTHKAARAISRAHVVAFLLVSIAYGANDGQKMLAVFALATGGTVATGVAPDPVLLAAIAALFALGAALGVRRLGTRFGSGVLAVRSVNTVSAELAAATAVLGSSTIGAPVSMTQAVTGGLVGTGVTDGLRRIRWGVAAGIATAWLVTLPMAVVVAGALSLTTRLFV